MLFGICPYQSKSIAMLISTISNNDITIPLEINQITEKTQNLLRKLLTKDYFRRLSWI
jgi:serine/threonine-protein kinase ULK/ATG1